MDQDAETFGDFKAEVNCFLFRVRPAADDERGFCRGAEVGFHCRQLRFLMPGDGCRRPVSRGEHKGEGDGSNGHGKRQRLEVGIFSAAQESRGMIPRNGEAGRHVSRQRSMDRLVGPGGISQCGKRAKIDRHPVCEPESRWRVHPAIGADDKHGRECRGEGERDRAEE